MIRVWPIGGLLFPNKNDPERIRQPSELMCHQPSTSVVEVDGLGSAHAEGVAVHKEA